MKKCFDDLEDLTHTHTDSHRICALNYLLPGKLFLALDRYVTPPPNNPHSGYTHTHTPGHFSLTDLLAPSFRLPAIYSKHWHTSLLSFPQHSSLSSPPFFTFAAPHFLPLPCFFFLFTTSSQWRRRFFLRPGKFLPGLFFFLFSPHHLREQTRL